ncbi:MAG TPA: hypothetical protein VML55_06330, partial [Planctomycetaceae bacterium]|nr:hypothetical protein [Planctomycetaceae bacterium]
ESQWPKWTKGPFRWRNGFDLTANEGEFFRLTKAEQLERLTDFIRDSHAAARKIGRSETPENQAL